MEKLWQKQELIAAVEDEMRRVGYKESTIGHYWEVWVKYLRFSESNTYDLDEVNEFLKTTYDIDETSPSAEWDKNKTWTYRRMQVLKSYSRFNVIFGCEKPMMESVECSCFIDEIKHFLHLCEQLGYADSTMRDYRYQLKMLAIYFEKREITSSELLTPEMVSQYTGAICGYRGRTLNNILSKLRKYFKFLYTHEYHPIDLSVYIPTACNLKRREHLPVILSRDEVKRILDCVDTANPIGKRDYAIILLVARLGLRIGDVVNIKYHNINWDRNCIELLQEKTGQPVCLPLFNDVGTSIINYLKFGRPVSDSDHIFIRHYPPFSNLREAGTMSHALKKYMSRAGIEIASDRRKGMHILRHSLATELLNNNVPLPVISGILGHTSIESTENYLRVDIEKLKQCTLTVEVSGNEN